MTTSVYMVPTWKHIFTLKKKALTFKGQNNACVITAANVDYDVLRQSLYTYIGIFSKNV